MTRNRTNAGSHIGRALAREAELLAAIAAAEAELTELRTYVSVHRRLDGVPEANGHDPAPARTPAPVGKGATAVKARRASPVAPSEAVAPKAVARKAAVAKTAPAPKATPAPNAVATPKAVAAPGIATGTPSPAAPAAKAPAQVKQPRPSGTSPGDVVKMIELILEEAGKPCTREELVASLEENGAVLATRKSKKWYVSHVLWRCQDVIENLGAEGYRIKPETPPTATAAARTKRAAARSAAA